MIDRAPTKPNRYAVYDDAHNFIRYEYHERADEPTQEGDPLCKETLLPDDVVSTIGLTAADPQVKDALMALAMGTYQYAYVMAFTRPDGSPIAGLTIAGVVSRTGGACITNSNGIAAGLSNSASPTISYASGYVDLVASSKALASTGTVTYVNITVALANDVAIITTSQNLVFSEPVSADIHLIGAGENGHSSPTSGKGGNGGNSGYQYYQLGVPIDAGTYAAVIGATGGAQTTFKGLSSASGSRQNGGAGGSLGSPGNDGCPSTTKLFGTGEVVGGGSGGGGAGNSSPYGGVGGSPYGGNGGCGSTSSGGNINANAGRGYGGGGGGAAGRDDSTFGAGYQGALYIRWRYAA